jgi:flagellar assembly protein FliH
MPGEQSSRARASSSATPGEFGPFAESIAEDMTAPETGEDIAVVAGPIQQTWQFPEIKHRNVQINEQVHQAILKAIQKRTAKVNERLSLVLKPNDIEAEDYEWPGIQTEPPTFLVAESKSEKKEKEPSPPVLSEKWEAQETETLRQAIVEEIRSQAEMQADQIREQASQQASQILEQARAEAEKILQQAKDEYTETVRRAHQEGMLAAQNEAASMLQSGRAIIAEALRWREQLLEQSEPIVLGLLKDIAQAMFGSGITLNAETLSQTFAQAMAEAKSLGAIRILAHPDDIAMLEPLWAEQQSAQSGQTIELAANQSILRGGCLIEGEFGMLDARIETKLKRVMETLDEVLKEQQTATHQSSIADEQFTTTEQQQGEDDGSPATGMMPAFDKASSPTSEALEPVTANEALESMDNEQSQAEQDIAEQDILAQNTSVHETAQQAVVAEAVPEERSPFPAMDADTEDVIKAAERAAQLIEALQAGRIPPKEQP